MVKISVRTNDSSVQAFGYIKGLGKLSDTTGLTEQPHSFSLDPANKDFIVIWTRNRDKCFIEVEPGTEFAIKVRWQNGEFHIAPVKLPIGNDETVNVTVGEGEGG